MMHADDDVPIQKAYSFSTPALASTGQIMSEAPITKEQRLKRIQDHISRMPSLSTTVTKVLEICNSPTTSPNDLNRVISLDPVLTGKVLKTINSAYYSLPKQVTSLTRAIILLGLNTVKNLALSTEVMENMGRKESFQALSMDDFWTHSICVGVTAKSLAAIKGVPITGREEYFVAGLLHDLGKIPLNDRFPDEYRRTLELTKQEQNVLRDSETLSLSIDHCAVGGMIAEKWQLYENLIDTLLYHHNADEAKEETRPFVSTVALANAYANIFEIGSAGDPFPEESTVMDLLETMGVDWSKLSALYETVLDEIEKARVFLQMAGRG
jgi:HD-like signal output (HDOD) protein